VVFSIVGTCLKNNINVYTYLHWVLKKVASHKITPDAVDWLPHSIDLAVLEHFAVELGE
jgi:IS66 C-terminal element